MTLLRLVKPAGLEPEAAADAFPAHLVAGVWGASDVRPACAPVSALPSPQAGAGAPRCAVCGGPDDRGRGCPYCPAVTPAELGRTGRLAADRIAAYGRTPCFHRH